MRGRRAALAAVLLPFSAAAQEAPAGMEVVVVTAEHRSEFALDVPFAVTSISGETVADLASDGEDIRFLAARTPSLNAESSFGRTFPRFYIRGLGNPDFAYNAQQPVSVVVDDVALENPILKAFPVFDVADVEVLRGPQGTLFGRNTPAGVVKIATERPGDVAEGFADLSWGTYDTVNFTGAVGGPIVTDRLDFRLSVSEERRDDWVTNVNPDTRYHPGLEGYSDFAARGQLLLKPDSDVDALLEVDARSLDGTARLFRANVIKKGSNDLVPGFDPAVIDLNGDNYLNLGTWGAHLTVDDDLGSVTLTSVSAYEHGSTRSRGDISGGNFTLPPPAGTAGAGFPDETSDTIPGLDQVSEELRVATNGGGAFFDQGGIYYFHEYLKVENDDYTPAGAADIAMTQAQATESFGVFDSATWKPIEALALEAGIRFSTDDKRYTVGCTLTCAAPDPASLGASGSQVTWDLGATYTVVPDVNLYGRIATGYLAPALDGRNVLYDFGDKALGTLTEAGAETTISYEAGLKSSIWDHRLTLDLAGYAWTTDHMQLTAVGGEANTTILLNARKAVGEGLEIELAAEPILGLVLSMNGSYNLTAIRDPALEVPGCGGGCTMVSPRDPKTGFYRIDGDPLPNAPRFIGNVTVRYGAPIDGREGYIVTDWSYRGTEDFFLYRAREFAGQSLLLGGVRLGLKDPAGWEAAVFIRNILDQVKVTGAIDFDNLTGFVNDPRIVGVEARVRF